MGGLSGSSGGAASADGFLEVTRFNKAYVSIGGATHREMLIGQQVHPPGGGYDRVEKPQATA